MVHAPVSRVSCAAWSLVTAVVTAAGCAGPAIRSQSPEIEALAQLEEGTKLVGDYTAPWGLAP